MEIINNQEFLNFTVKYNSTDDCTSGTWNFENNDGNIWNPPVNDYQLGYAYIYNYYWDWYRPVLIGSLPEKSKTEQAFKIVKVLIEKKMVSGNLKVKDFIDLVETISKEL